MNMKKLTSAISPWFMIAVLFCSLASPVFSQTDTKKDTACYSKEQIDLGKIATFRDNYTPKEYLPLPEYLVYIDLAILLLLMLTGIYFVVKKKPAKWLTWLSEPHTLL